ncbi:DUF309 domain-containing protein [Paenibacillus sp. Soil522]|uniref:DUF309 domain-containing protein n=1 Tax=Paenibacillus sp. Soil522 TaxID=1736388 RepID=UPI0007021AB1|nr:DUF309 domain-containing protein [Paenibacillus sp. Soil522]KRE25031.1 hypothetical protein ASG81_27045 [Paenibacillus sp. Soil522]
MITFPNAYISYLVEFHASRDYFECHELLEEYWKEHPGDPFANTWVGLIQLAVGLYHERRGNLRGAAKMLVQAEQKLSLSPLEKLGIDKDSLQKQLIPRIAALQAEDETVYSDFNLRIINDEVFALCKQACKDRGLVWGSPSPLDDDSIIHRHTRRDRSDVIAERLKAYTAKKRERNGLS